MHEMPSKQNIRNTSILKIIIVSAFDKNVTCVYNYFLLFSIGVFDNLSRGKFFFLLLLQNNRNTFKNKVVFLIVKNNFDFCFLFIERKNGSLYPRCVKMKKIRNYGRIQT